MGIFSQKFENPKPRFPEGKIPEPEKTRSQKPDLDPDPEMSTPNPPRPRLLLPDYITISPPQTFLVRLQKHQNPWWLTSCSKTVEIFFSAAVFSWKRTRQKKAKFFIIKTGMLLFLTGDASCQKMLTLWGQTIFFPSMSEF